MITATDIRNHLKRHEFSPVYGFWPETYLRDVAAKHCDLVGLLRIFALSRNYFSLNVEGSEKRSRRPSASHDSTRRIVRS